MRRFISTLLCVMRVTDVKPVTDCVSIGDIVVCQSPHVQLHNDQSQLTTSTSAAGHLLSSLVHSSTAHVKRECRLFIISISLAYSVHRNGF